MIDSILQAIFFRFPKSGFHLNDNQFVVWTWFNCRKSKPDYICAVGSNITIFTIFKPTMPRTPILQDVLNKIRDKDFTEVTRTRTRPRGHCRVRKFNSGQKISI